MKRILFVEDDPSLISGLSFALKKQGYEIDIARTGMEAGQLWQNGTYALVILDVSLPDSTGYDLCRKIRETSRVPIMFLTAADEETDIIMGLDMGGDDYITKPFKLAVFLSRVNALLRRSEDFSRTGPELSSNGIRVQRMKREVYKNGTRVELTAGEYKLLCLFMENPDMVLSPEQILGRLWDCEENYIDSSTLTVYIRRLRTKIEDNPAAPQNDKIRIAWRKFAPVVQIVVRDNGGGIHPEDLPHIFKRFYRSRFSGDTQGIGLGLALTKAVVEAHNGTIEADSELGAGAAFTMNFLIPTKL